MGNYIIRYGIYSNLIYWNIFLVLLFSYFLFLIVFSIKNYKYLNFSRASFDPLKLKRDYRIFGLMISILAFSVINIEVGRADEISSPYPWENRYLNEGEIEKIEYFQNEDIGRLIFVR